MLLIGVVVEVFDNDVVSGMVMDIDGYFCLDGVLIGWQVLCVSYLGYELLIIFNIVVIVGKEVILQLVMEEVIMEFDVVVVSVVVDKDKV